MFEVRAVDEDLIERCKFESDALLVAAKDVFENQVAVFVYAVDTEPRQLVWSIAPTWAVTRDGKPGTTISVTKGA